MTQILLIPIALLFDRILGEPCQFHPLVGFGKFADAIESALNQHQHLFLRGIMAWAMAVMPISLVIFLLDHWLENLWLGALCGWLAIGWKSLREHGLAVLDAFKKNDLESARIKTSYLVSRDTSELDESELSRATIESILENGSDAIFAPLFWLALFGAPGVVLYRLSNTLDAMWGYRNDRFEQFGKFSARVDDVLNYIPARISALLYTLVGNSASAWRAWKTQGNHWYSPNAGVVMASGAGALNLALGGNAIYQGKEKQRPRLGDGKTAQPNDIKRAIQLIDLSTLLMSAFAILLFLNHFLMP